MVERRLDHVLGALADPTRRAILKRLRRRPATVTGVAKPLPMSLAAVSKHLRVLEHAGLIRREVRGREHWLHLRAAPLGEVDAWLSDYRVFWDTRLDQLEAYLGRKRSVETETGGRS